MGHGSFVRNVRSFCTRCLDHLGLKSPGHMHGSGVHVSTSAAAFGPDCSHDAILCNTNLGVTVPPKYMCRICTKMNTLHRFNTLQRTATHCSTLQRYTTHCKEDLGVTVPLKYICPMRMETNRLQRSHVIQYTAIHCHTL